MLTHHRIRFFLVTTLALAACAPSSRAENDSAEVAAGQPRAMQTIAVWRAELDTLAAALTVLDSTVQVLETPVQREQARAAFSSARLSFKRAETGLEYYAPSTAREINGPALPEVEEGEGPDVVLAPTGFQVVEEHLFDDATAGEDPTVRQEVRTLANVVRRSQTMMAAQLATDDRVWDAAKLEVARIVTLGISGFDSPVAGRSLAEGAAAFEGIARALAPYRADTPEWIALEAALRNATRALAASSDRESFDHLGFIVQHANPAARAIDAARRALGISVPTELRAFRMNAVTLFDSSAFDVRAFAPIDVKQVPDARVALGAQLFHDARLSGDGSRACSSCHVPSRAFTDGQVKSRGRSGQPLPRNTPSIINSGLQVGSFADLRTTYLEDQVTEVVENADEMHAKLPDVAAVLRRDSALVRQFGLAFDTTAIVPDSLVTGARIRRALAAYMRSLTALNSPVDRALRGDTAALTADERRGFNVFVGKGKCATCHFLPLTNGTVPPMYQKSDVEVIGVPSRPDTIGARIDPDVGRFRITRSAPHRFAFRTPSLRNVALTAPYMHNGAYRTLESVVDFYNRGGGAGIGIELEYQTLPPDRLNLTTAEQRSLVSFLRALTDTTGTPRR
jgi:cytochrome c peroxidase